MSTDRFANTQHIATDNTLFDQLTTMTKAHAYDIISEKCQELEAENKILREQVKTLKDLIKEYTEKMLNNLK